MAMKPKTPNPKKKKSKVPLRLRQAAMSAAHEGDSLLYDLPHLFSHAKDILDSPEATPHIKKDAKHVIKHGKRIARSAEGIIKNMKNVPEARSQYNWIGGVRQMLKKKKLG